MRSAYTGTGIGTACRSAKQSSANSCRTVPALGWASCDSKRSVGRRISRQSVGRSATPWRLVGLLGLLLLTACSGIEDEPIGETQVALGLQRPGSCAHPALSLDQQALWEHTGTSTMSASTATKAAGTGSFVLEPGAHAITAKLSPHVATWNGPVTMQVRNDTARLDGALDPPGCRQKSRLAGPTHPRPRRPFGARLMASRAERHPSADACGLAASGSQGRDATHVRIGC